MLNRHNVPLAVLAVVAFLVIALAFAFPTVKAEVNFSETTPAQGIYQNFTFFTATSTTATSTNITGGGGYLKIAGAKKVELYFSRGDTSGKGNAGLSKFRVQVTPDGTNWFDYSKLVGSDAAATATSTVTIGTATSTVVANMDIIKDTFYGVRCIVNQTTDGEHTCKASAEY